MNPSISTRNFIGGLLGGFAGILLAWYLNLAFMPVGVLFGVVTGWWHAEIIGVLKNAHARAKATTTSFANAIGESISFLGQSIGMPRWIVGMFRWIIAKAIIGSIVAIITMPTKLYRFTKSHPTNLAYTMRVFFCFAGAIAFTGGVYKIAIWYGATIADTPLLAIFSLLAGLAAGSVYLPPDLSELGEMKIYYREWEILSRYGVVGLSCYFTAMYVRYLVGSLLFASFCIGFCLPGMMICFLATYPILAFVSVCWGIFQLMKRAGHWLCFAVTLTTTFISWLIWRNSFEDPLILWSVALITGVVSGILTEQVRKLSHLIEQTKTGRWLSNDPWERVIDVDNGYTGKVFTQVFAFGFQQHKVARIFRAICFGTPIARPVS